MNTFRRAVSAKICIGWLMVWPGSTTASSVVDSDLATHVLFINMAPLQRTGHQGYYEESYSSGIVI